MSEESLEVSEANLTNQPVAFDKQRLFKRIDERSPEYQFHRKHVDIDHDPSNQVSDDKIFGASVYKLVDQLEYTEEESGDEAVLTDKIIAITRSCRSRLLQIVERDGASALEPFVAEALKLPWFYERYAGKSATNSDVIQEILDPKKVEDAVFADLLVNHVEKLKLKRQEFNNYLPELIRAFHERVVNGELPIDPDIFEERMKNLVVHVKDPLVIKLSNILGSANVDNDAIWVGLTDEKDVEKVFTHEMVHFISGRSYLGIRYYNRDVPESAEYSNYVYTVQRVGTSINNPSRYDLFPDGKLPKNPRYVHNRFNWLNEAITEETALKLIGKESSSSYFLSRHLFNLLKTKGKSAISDDLFVRAYFENYDVHKPHGDRIPAWKGLIESINQAYSPGFLARLDNYIKEAKKNGHNGIQRAINAMEKDWKIVDEYRSPK